MRPAAVGQFIRWSWFGIIVATVSCERAAVDVVPHQIVWSAANRIQYSDVVGLFQFLGTLERKTKTNLIKKSCGTLTLGATIRLATFSPIEPHCPLPLIPIHHRSPTTPFPVPPHPFRSLLPPPLPITMYIGSIIHVRSLQFPHCYSTKREKERAPATMATRRPRPGGRDSSFFDH